jgi:hypothetical protein
VVGAVRPHLSPGVCRNHYQNRGSATGVEVSVADPLSSPVLYGMRQVRPVTTRSAARGVAALLVILAAALSPSSAEANPPVAPTHPVTSGGEEGVAQEPAATAVAPARGTHDAAARSAVAAAVGSPFRPRHAGSSPRSLAARSDTVRAGGHHLRC